MLLLIFFAVVVVVDVVNVVLALLVDTNHIIFNCGQ